MILVVGGSFQGKLDFSIGLYAKELPIVKGGDTIKEEDYGQFHILNKFHLLVRRWLVEHKEIKEAMKEFLLCNPDLTIITDEVGYGIVPLDQTEREYREAVGRCCCIMAQEAAEVYRVVCGIGRRIK